MKEKHFDELISKGKLTDAARIFAKEYYENGKMGHTRKLLIEKLADKVDRLEQGPICVRLSLVSGTIIVVARTVGALLMGSAANVALSGYRRGQNKWINSMLLSARK